MVSVDELKVDYLGRSDQGHPCFLMDSGKIALYNKHYKSFLFFEKGSLCDAGEVVFSSNSLMSSRDDFCIHCNTTCDDGDNSIEINLLDETIKKSVDVSPRSLRKFLHEIFYGDGKISYTLELEGTRLCEDCYKMLTEEINGVLKNQSDSIVSSLI